MAAPAAVVAAVFDGAGGAAVDQAAAVALAEKPVVGQVAGATSQMWTSWIGRRRSPELGNTQPSRLTPVTPSDLPVPVVKLALAPNEGVAQVWRSVLESEGIPCYLKCAGVGPADYTTSVCPHALYVFASQAKQARRLLGLG